MNPPPAYTPCDRRRTHFILLAVILSLCVLANMIFIFWMSAEPPEKSSDLSGGVTDMVVDVVYPDIEELPPAEQESIFESVHHIVRKLAHFLEFALLGFLSYLLIRHLSRRLPALVPWLRGSIPAGFCLLYAISDEVHQIFTGRGPAVRDVLIDFSGSLTGILVGVGLVWLLRCRIHIAKSHSDRKELAA